jgi:lycopene beta-cyclase
LKQYDFIFAGGGAAGLSLAYHILHSSLRDRKILLIDRDKKRVNDRTWCFWSDRPTHFDEIYFRSWAKIGFRSTNFSDDFVLSPYRYNMVRGIDFYNFTRSQLSEWPNVDFVIAPIEQVWEAPDAVLVTAGGETYQGKWLFDSRFNPRELQQQSVKDILIWQHFKGWEIETENEAFDPAIPILFDFRTPQEHNMRFMYILPYSPRNALVEYTLFSPRLLDDEEYDQGLKYYLEGQLGLATFQIISTEKGAIPMSTHSFNRRPGEKILNTGTRGGRVKPSSGYAFLRIQHDSTAIIHSLERHRHPFAVPQGSRFYRFLDSILLKIMLSNGAACEEIFTDMFRRNPIQRIFRFLDEKGGLWDNLGVITSVPSRPFLQAFFRLKVLGEI